MTGRTASDWYDRTESDEEHAARHDRFGNVVRPPATAFDRVIDRAHAIVYAITIRPPRGIALPFGLEETSRLRWRVAMDIYDVLRIGSAGRVEFMGPSMAGVERLFGIEIAPDATAEPGAIELLEEAPG
ncbi:MAG: hypothetical protein V4515_12180 [Chloroflexota bacterium]